MIVVETAVGVSLIILSMMLTSFASSNVSMFLKWLFEWNYLGKKWIVILRLISLKIKNKKIRSFWNSLCPVLGRCIYCQSTWISIFFCIYFLGFNLAYIIICMGMNYFFIEKFMKFLYPY